MYNTWVLTSYFADLEQTNHFVQKIAKSWPKSAYMTLIAKQVLYLFGILSPNHILELNVYNCVTDFFLYFGLSVKNAKSKLQLGGFFSQDLE